jgi:anion-transporting  ArsA/GET3 family ATPase
MMSARDTDWDGVRLHVVTGKGGTGKTTVAAALALALAAGGKKVLLVEVEGRQGIAQVFDLPPLPYEERRIAVAPGGGDVYALAIDPEAAMLEYLEMFYGMRRAGRALTKMGVVDFATTIAPGLRDVLVTGKTSEAVRRRDPATGRRVYDAVVLDAPPTGRVTRFLNVTSEVAGLARVGPIKNHADLVRGVVASPETAVHIVTLLEEMPVQETLDGIAELRAAKLPVGGIFINMVRAEELPQSALEAALKGRFEVSELVLGLKAAGVADGAEATAVAEALAAEVAEHARRTQLERRERRLLAKTGVPRYELPLLAEGVDLAGLYELAEVIREQGVV